MLPVPPRPRSDPPSLPSQTLAEPATPVTPSRTPSPSPSPSTHYRPDFPADSPLLPQYEHLKARADHPAPDGAIDPLPHKPAYRKFMTPEQAAASAHFRNDYRLRRRAAHGQDSADPANRTRPEFLRHGREDDFTHSEMGRTYRRAGDGMRPNGPGPIFGETGEPSLPHRSGSFPPGTTVDIHSHPWDYTHAPSPMDQAAIFEKRTNALNPPGVDVAMGMVYHPKYDSFLGFDGRLHGGERVEGRAHPGEPFFYSLHNPYDMNGAQYRHPGTNGAMPLPGPQDVKSEYEGRALPQDPPRPGFGGEGG